jgi:hypothetical protein
LFAYLVNLDALQLGFTRPTWSLGSPAEYRFRDTSASHYDVFDVRWLIQPRDRPPPIPDAERVASRGGNVLYEMPDDGPVDVVDVGEPITADRTDLGVKIAPWLSSAGPAQHVVPGISFDAFPAAQPTVTDGETPASPPGRVLATTNDIADGRVATTVELSRPGAVILKQSFDNRWTVTVDGEAVSPQMFAPGFVGREIPTGRHEIVFEYAPFPRYDLLLLVGVLAFAMLLLGPRWLARRRGYEEPAAPPAPDEPAPPEEPVAPEEPGIG